MNVLTSCNLCNRNCNVNRYHNRGVCGANYKLKVARCALHYFEEPCISGTNGSGAIFFSNCNLKCVFCQNKKISTNGYGEEISIKRFSEICLELQNEGAHNINLVTPTMYVPHIVKGIKKARNNGLSIPIIYNTSSYENVSTIKMLDKTIDVYLPDLKYYDDSYAVKYSHVENYFNTASKAIDEMYNQVGSIEFDKNGMIIKGIIVRVLLLPGLKEDAKKIINYLYNKYNDNIYISIMNQYTPLYKFKNFTNLNNKVTEEEYYEVVNYACDLGVVNGFIQEGETQDISFIPNFDKTGIKKITNLQ